MKTAGSKILISFLIAAILVSGIVWPKKTKAIWGLGDIVSDPWHTITTAAGWAKDVLWEIKDQLLDALRDAIVKRVVDMMTDQVVAWIQGGGEPKFVTDWEGFLGDAFQAGVGDVISQTDLAWLCRPFSFQVRLSLLPVPKFSQRVTCTLDDIIANIDDFYNDFRNGSWIAYEASWRPENNYYGVLYMTMDEAMAKGAQQKEASQQEAQAGKGFLSIKECTDGAPLEKDTEENRRIMKEGGYVRDYKGNYCLPENMQIVTPGDTVGETVANTLNLQGQWVTNVKSIVSAIVNAALNRLISEGLSLMKGSEEETDGSYNIAPPEYQDIVSQELERQKQQMIDEYQKLLNNRQAILNSKQQSLSNAETLLVVLNELKNRNCQPPVSDEEITATQSDIDRLKIETAELQKIFNEINTNINEIRQISEDNRDREMALVVNKYNQFLDKYDFLYDKITAQTEANDFQTKLSNAQDRLKLCLAT